MECIIMMTLSLLTSLVFLSIFLSLTCNIFPLIKYWKHIFIWIRIFFLFTIDLIENMEFFGITITITFSFFLSVSGNILTTHLKCIYPLVKCWLSQMNFLNLFLDTVKEFLFVQTHLGTTLVTHFIKLEVWRFLHPKGQKCGLKIMWLNLCPKLVNF